jgi:UDP:flavonoid glycosyltransferase YjiC (YdhE family)
VLFTGSPAMRARLPDRLPETIHCVDYAPHATLFPRAEVVVHHGGIGTSAEALVAGVPMLVVPHGFDQPDNAARLRRLGVAESLPVQRYRADRAVALLQRLQEPHYRERARACAELLRGADGAARAADVIEAVLAAAPGRAAPALQL